MTLSPLSKKLRLQGASRALILNSPDGYFELLSELDTEPEIANEPDAKFEFAHLFAATTNELDEKIEGALKAIE